MRRLYHSCDFNGYGILKIKDKDGMGLIDINTTAVREQVGEIERGIMLLKGPVRSVV